MENSETRMEQELEDTNQHHSQQQHPGNHNDPGPDRFGGTRPGAANVEPPTSIEKATDVDRVGPLDQGVLDEDLSVNGSAERAPERDERGMI